MWTTETYLRVDGRGNPTLLFDDDICSIIEAIKEMALCYP